MRIQSSHHHADRGLDAYFSPPEAAGSLLHIESQYLPKRICQIACNILFYDDREFVEGLIAGFMLIRLPPNEPTFRSEALDENQ